MIELKDVSKYYGAKAAVVDLSFNIREGETFGLIGTSGCGKTTTLKLINQLITPSSGKIKINDQDTNAQRPESLRRKIGYVIQDVGLFPHYSVQQNIATVPKLLDWQDQRIQRRITELLQLVGLEPNEFADRAPNELSGGQQQRVGLARALAADPPVILMDEPFGALDPITKHQIRREVKQLFSTIEKTIVLVTHDVIEAFDMCDRLCLLDQGQVQQIGTPKELLFHPENDFVASFFEANRLQLEMMSITVGDILETFRHLTDVQNSSLPAPTRSEKEEQEDKVPVAMSSSFFSVFEKFESTYNSYLILDTAGQPFAMVPPDELLKGFHRVRRELKGEHNG